MRNSKIRGKFVVPPRVFEDNRRNTIQKSTIQGSTIGIVCSVNDLETSENSKITIGSYFSSFRKIPSGFNNLLLAIITGVIDYSVSYSVVGIIENIYNELLKYQRNFIGESENILSLCKKIIDLIKSSKDISVKFKILEEIYNDSTCDLAVLMRNIMLLTIRKKYHTSKYKEFRLLSQDSFEEILEVIKMPTGTPALEHFIFFLDYFNINLRFLDYNTLTISSMDSNTDIIIYLYQIADCYYPLHTIEESMLRTLDPQSYLYFLTFMSNYEAFPQADVADVEAEMISAQKEKDKIANAFFNVNLIDNPDGNLRKTIDILGGDNREFLEELFEDYECNICSVHGTVHEIECGHKICENCFNYNRNNELIVCNKCGFPSNVYEIYRKIA